LKPVLIGEGFEAQPFLCNRFDDLQHIRAGSRHYLGQVWT
jgi:hypothetical protein